MTAKLIATQGVYVNDVDYHVEIDGQHVSIERLVDLYNQAITARDTHLDFVFAAPPGPDDQCVFIEVERDGKSLRVGEWLSGPNGGAILRITPADFDAQHIASTSTTTWEN